MYVLLSALPLHWPTTSQHAAEVLPVALVASATRRSGTSQTTSVLLSVLPVQRPTTGEASGEDCVQQAVLSSATDMSHVTPAHWAVAPGVAANPAPQSSSDTAATPAVVAPFASSQVPKTHVTAPPSVLGVVPSASAVVPAHAAQASVGAAENCPETHAVQAGISIGVHLNGIIEEMEGAKMPMDVRTDADSLCTHLFTDKKTVRVTSPSTT